MSNMMTVIKSCDLCLEYTGNLSQRNHAGHYLLLEPVDKERLALLIEVI